MSKNLSKVYPRGKRKKNKNPENTDTMNPSERIKTYFKVLVSHLKTA